MTKSKSTKTKKTIAAPVKIKPPKNATIDGAQFKKLSAPMQAGLAAVAAMAPNKETKLALIIKLLMRPEGATIDDMVAATGWKKHTVRAVISHALVKKRGHKIASDKPVGGQRIYKAEST